MSWPAGRPLPLPEEELPILYQEEEDDGMGEANLHLVWTHILYYGLKVHLANRPELQVYSNLNVYYRHKPLHPKTRSRPNVAADSMVVQPFAPLPVEVKSYTIGEDGPAPLLVAEVLSPETARRRDLKKKVDIYGGLAVAEYLLADPTRRYLPERLLLKRLLPDNSWQDVCDPDGGLTSQLGFRVVLDGDQHLRVLNLATGKRYFLPDEAQELAEQQRESQDKIRLLEAELERLRGANGAGKNKGETKGPRRPKP
jgi:Uma2 family endonuclease